MMFWSGAHWVFWQASLMWLGMILFWGVLIWAVYGLITAATRKPRHDSSAREVLDQRLARGEIDAAEYLRLRDLMSSSDQRDSAGAGSAR